jgi:glycosyltransferase involved in cell wall biosynthesis
MSARTIVWFIGSLNVGGAERHAVQILPRLDRNRWRPLCYCLAERGVLADQLEAEGVPVLTTPIEPPQEGASRIRRTVRIARVILNLTGVLKELNPAVAHFFLPAAYILGAPAAALASVPVRIMSRRSLNNYQQDRPLAGLIESRLHPGMTAILGNSRRVIDQLRTLERVPQRKLGLIYNGIDVGQAVEGARSRVRAQLGIPPDALVFVIVANLIPYKGHHDLIDAFARAAARLPVGWRLLVVGRDDGIGPGLRTQAESAGIAPNVVFLGERRDVGGLLAASDVNLLSSHQEGFSNAVLEGMAAGLPSIVTDVGGNPEAVIDGQNGLVVPPHDAERFAFAIERLAADAGLRAAMGDSARTRAKEHFTLETCVARYEELYASLLAGRKPCEIESIRVGLSPPPFSPSLEHQHVP